MVDYLGTRHHFLTCNMEELADLLYASVRSRDMPTMADVDSSLLYFCKLVSQQNKVVLTGECADEIFGGYPWFYREDLLAADTFPWMMDLSPRKLLLKKDVLDALSMDDYVQNLYYTIISEVQTLPEESETEKSRRRIGYMNIRMFMQTLLDRMDRTSMFNGLEARVPFADIHLLQYVFNVPWEFKYRNHTEKSLLRHAAKGLVPEEILFRKKVLIQRHIIHCMNASYPSVFGKSFWIRPVQSIGLLKRNRFKIPRCAERLWKAMVWTVNGRAADDGIPAAD